MNAQTILKRCAAGGVRLQFSMDAIRYRAPAGTLTPELKEALAESKAALLDQFNERAAILEFDAGLDRAEAERLAAEEVLGGSAP